MPHFHGDDQLRLRREETASVQVVELTGGNGHFIRPARCARLRSVRRALAKTRRTMKRLQRKAAALEQQAARLAMERRIR